MGNEGRDQSAISIILASLIGGLVGAGVALLFAPMTGKETRQKIKDMAEDAQEKAVKLAEEVKSQVASTVEKGKGVFEEKKSLITTAFEAGKEAYEKGKEKPSKG